MRVFKVGHRALSGLRFVLGLALLGVMTAGAVKPSQAVPAAPFVNTLAQPDGTQFQARLRGDEHFHWYETANGHPILQDARSGYWNYALPTQTGVTQRSGRIVGKQTPPVAPWQVRSPRFRLKDNGPQRTVSPTGTGFIPVILVNFPDRTTTYSTANFNTLLFGGGKSMKALYSEMSGGKFTVGAGPGGVVGWYTAAHPHDYYGANKGGAASDSHPAELVAEAVAAADAAGFDFSPYDQNHDGYVDVVDIVHQGTGEEVGGHPTTDIWSHRWDLNSAKYYGDGAGAYQTNDGVKVNDYVIEPEIFNGTTLATVGVFCHEYGHAMGLPDLYDVDYSSQGIGTWSLMAGGVWNGSNGDTPAHMDAWCKSKLNWLNISTPSSSILGASIPNVEQNYAAYKIPLDGAPATEYLLVENRQKIGFDAGLSGTGLLIWHIDDTLGAISTNTTNTKEWYPGNTGSGHYGVALQQADGRFDMEKNVNQGDAGDPYPGTSLVRAFDNTTTPASRPYAGGSTCQAIRNISNSASTMTADLYVNCSAPAALTLSITPNSFSEAAGANAATGTVTRNTDTTSALIVNLSSNNTGKATVPANVTIPAGATYVTFPVAAVDNNIADNNQSVTLTASSTNFTSGTAAVTVTDNDVVGVSVTPTSGLVTTESGGTATFTVALTSQPTANVTIGLSSNNTNEGTVAPAALTFTAANWNVAQTVTVTGVDDNIQDGDQSYQIITAPASSSDAAYNNLNVADVSVTNRDNDSVGITVTPTSGLVTTEAGGKATFTVKLNSQPTASVTIGLSSSNTNEGTVAPAALTFTAANWNLTQTVTVTGVDDNIVDGDVAYTIITAPATVSPANGDLLYVGYNAADVSVTNQDNDVSTLSLSASPGSFSETAGANAATGTVTRNTLTTSALTVTLASNNTGKATVPANVTIPIGSATATFPVAAVDNSIADGSQSVTLTASSTSFTSGTAAVTVTDNDVVGVSVTPTTGLVTTEAGGTAAFTIALTSQPTSNVTIGLSSSNLSEGTVAPAALTFTAANWNVAQTVTVTGVDDNIADGDQSYQIITAPASSSDAAYNNLNVPDVSVTNRDDDSVGITVTPTAGLVTTEAGGKATFTVKLNSQPTANVTIGLSSSNTGEGTVSPAALAFTAANWNVAQTVTVTGVDDSLADGDVAYKIVTAPAVSADLNYQGLDALDVALLNQDNDVPALALTVAPLSFSEAAGATAATGTVTRNTPTTTALTVTLSSNNTGKATVPASLIIPAGAASANFPISAVDNNMVDGDQSATLTASAANYSSDTAIVTVTDNETAGIAVTPTTGLITTEAGGSATFTVQLNSQPIANVTLALSSNNTAEGTADPAALTFTAANWDKAQTVTVTGVDDAVQDGDVTYKVVLAPAQSSDGNYNNFKAADVTVVNKDNDQAGLTITAPADMVTTEAGGSATFTMALTSQPTADVTILLSSSNLGEGTVAPASLVFTPGNWNVPQTVAVTGVDDNIADGDVAYTIITGAPASADAVYAALSASDTPDVPVVNKDNDTAGVSISPTTGLITTKGGGTALFAVALNSQPTANVTIGLASSDINEGTVAPASLAFTPANWNVAQFVTVTGVDNGLAEGNQLYKIVTSTSSDDAVYKAIKPSDVAVTNNDNHQPTLTLRINAAAFSEAAGTAAAMGTVTRNTPTNSALVVSLSSSNTGKVVVPVTVNIPAGATSATFPLAAINNAIVDGTQLVTFAASAAGFNTGGAGVNVTDDDTPSLALTISSDTFSEAAGAGAALGTITRNMNLDAALNVQLSSSNPNAATVAATVTVPAGATTTTFALNAVNDNTASGPQTVAITASAAGLSATKNVTVTDTVTPTLALSVNPATFAETAGVSAATGTVSRNTPTTTALMVNLSSNNSGAATVPATVTIPAGAAAATFPVGAADDKIVDGAHQAALVARAAGFTPGAATVTVTDDDKTTVATFTLGGHVLLNTGTSTVALSGVTLQLTQNNSLKGTATTDAAGFYQFKGLAEGTYAVTAVKPNYVFTPASRTLKLGPSLANADFAATPHIALSGRLTRVVKGKAQPLVKTLVFARSKDIIMSVRTNINGDYLFDNLSLTPGTYYLAPGLTGVYFNPRWRQITVTALSPVAAKLDFVVAGNDAIGPTVKVTTPQMNNATTLLSTAKGTARDGGTSGLGFVTIAIARYASAKSTTPLGYWNWAGKTWNRADDPLVVEKLATGTTSWALAGLPKLPTGFYGLRATVTDNAANFANSGWVRFSMNIIGKSVPNTPEPQVALSAVKLSSATVSIATASIQLHFTGALDAETASDAMHYTVLVNGKAVEVQSAAYSTRNYTVSLTLPDGSLHAGDAVLVHWDQVLDTHGATVRGQAGPLAPR